MATLGQQTVLSATRVLMLLSLVAGYDLAALPDVQLMQQKEWQRQGTADMSGAAEVPAVFTNGAWDPDHSTTRNAYIAGLLSKDVYYKHMVDPRDGPAARRNFTIFATQFCKSMARLGADDCQPVAGAQSLVWALVRAGSSVLLVFRGSNTPQNWIADVTSLRTINVGDFGGGPAGANVAAGFYKVFAANRRSILERVKAAVAAAAQAAEKEKQQRRSASGQERGGGGGAGGDSDGDDAAASEGPGVRLWVFGHSLGGAVALMAASHLDVREGLTATGVYTFGCPRVGDASWVRAYRLQDVTLRLENTGDLIPTLPPGPSWRHVGAASTLQRCGVAAAGAEEETEEEAEEEEIEEEETEEEEEDGRDGALLVSDGSGSGGSVGRVGDGSEAGWHGDVEEGAAVTAAAAAADSALSHRYRRQRRLLLLRGAAAVAAGSDGGASVKGGGSDSSNGGSNDVGAGFPAAVSDGGGGGDGEEQQSDLDPDQAAAVGFPFPISFRDHWIETYVHVMWSCLPDSDQVVVPGPEDVYAD